MRDCDFCQQWALLLSTLTAGAYAPVAAIQNIQLHFPSLLSWQWSAQKPQRSGLLSWRVKNSTVNASQ
jgi:hypothetical protein